MDDRASSVATPQEATDEREYIVRQYRDGDRADLLSLYQDVLDTSMTRRWFEWKYEDNPYVDDVTVYVAERDGEMVGGAGFWVLMLNTGRRSIRAIQPCDAAIHPDHRRQGLYSRILRKGLDRFRNEGVEVAFDFPNRKTRGAFEKFGWRIVEERPTYYRVQRLSGLLTSQPAGPLGQVLLQSGTTLVRGYLGVRTRLGSTDLPDIDVERHEGVVPETLATVYGRRIPDRFHALRDARFYRWRFDNPHWNYTTYVGRREGTPVAAIVTGTRTDRETDTTTLTDVVPLVPDRRRDSTFVPVLQAVLEDARDAGLVSAPAGPIPATDLRRHGFRSDRSFPLSRAATQTVHGVYSLAKETDADWQTDSKRLTDADNWRVTFGEYDTN